MNKEEKQQQQKSISPFVAASRELINRYVERRDSGKISRVAPLIALRRAAGLYRSTPKEVLEHFASVSDEDGLVSQESYLQVFQSLSEGSDPKISFSAAQALFKSLVLSQDEDAVDFVELMTCVCLLVPGSLRERLQYVFSLYDLDEDGKIESPRDTMLLLLALLRLPLYGIVHHTHEDAKAQKVAIERISIEESEGYISFDAFYDWFVAFVDSDSCAANSNADVRLHQNIEDFEELREVAFEKLGLKHFLREEIASIFRESCQDGCISRSQFRYAFELLARMSSVNRDTPLFERVVDGIFDAIDSNGNGVITTSELNTGLAVLASA
jgi:Ca2+-binding EF-hand superfamily protein